MTRSRTIVLAWLCLAPPGAAVLGQTPPPIPIRPLGRVDATSKEPLSSIGAIRPLSDGRVLVNDEEGHRLLLLDASLAHTIIVADTSSTAVRAYGRLAGALFPFFGDSSLFADVAALAMLVVDPNGKINRVFSPPLGPAGGLAYLRSVGYGVAFDGIGNLVFQANGGMGVPVLPPGVPSVTTLERDSTLIVRTNLATKSRDTVARLRTPGAARITPSGVEGCVAVTTLSNPLPLADSWTVMSDGTIAVIRVIDYHIDWYAPNGVRHSSPRIQHSWIPFTDAQRAAFMDSVRVADSVADAADRAATSDAASSVSLANAAVAAAVARALPGTDDGTAGGGRGGGGRAGGAGIGVPAVPGMAGLAGGVSHGATQCRVPGPPTTGRQYIDPTALPDYLPPFLGQVGVAKADADGHIWIRSYEMGASSDRLVYDVVDRQGKLIDRIQLSPGATIVGFGPGVVYLSTADGGRFTLARANIH